MNQKYLFRLDDACETMNWEKWLRIESIFDKYCVKPLVAVIPYNQDPSMDIDPVNNEFWRWAKHLMEKGWELGLHGYDHVYVTKEGGMNPIHRRSEFAGLPLEEQKSKIKNGYTLLEKHGVKAKIFVAPSHTFDANTLTALKKESPIRIISDTIAFNPYKENSMIFIPQQLGAARKIPLPGTYTFCYHPNTMENDDFKKLEYFLENHNQYIASFNEIIDMKSIGYKTLLDKLFSYTYFTFRKIFR